MAGKKTTKKAPKKKAVAKPKPKAKPKAKAKPKPRAPKGRGRGKAKTDAKAIAAAERRTMALQLRKAGLTYQEIADRVGYSAPCGAYKAVKTALEALPVEAVDELRQVEGARLDQLQAGLWARAVAGNPKAIEQVLRIMARRAALMGLDVSKALEVDLTSGGQPLQFECAPGFGDWSPPERTKAEQKDVDKLAKEIADLEKE